MHMLYISRHVCTGISKHLLHFWTTLTTEGCINCHKLILCNKIMLCLKETILTSLITNKLQLLHTASPFCVLCASVKSQEDRTARFWGKKKTLNTCHQTNNEAFKIRKPTGLLEAYSTRCSTAFAVAATQKTENSSDEALSNLKD